MFVAQSPVTSLVQRFLNGDSEYRNARLKMVPSLVDGPLPIRLVAPPKKEKVVNCDWMPIIWRQSDEEYVKYCDSTETDSSAWGGQLEVRDIIIIILFLHLKF